MPSNASPWRELLVLFACWLVIGSFWPLKPRLPLPRRTANGAERLADGSLRLEHASVARTEGPAPFLEEALAARAFRIELEVRASAERQYGPARILTISEDPWRRDLSITQWDRHLGVRMRRPGASPNGVPELAFDDAVFADPGWHAIALELVDGLLTLDVDGARLYEHDVGPDALARWDASFPLALGDELTGSRPWLGEVRRAVVAVGTRRWDLLAPGALWLPERVWDVPEPVRSLFFWRTIGSPRDIALHTLAFAAVGAALVLGRGRRPRLGTLVLIAVLATLALELGKVFVRDRHPALADALPNTLGMLAGALVAARFVAPRQPPPALVDQTR